MTASNLSAAFGAASLLGSCMVAGKLYSAGLHSRYRALFAYFLLRILSGGYAMVLDVRSGAYFWFWVCGAPFSWALYILVVLELYRLVLKPYKGLYALGRWAMYLNIALSIGVSALTLLPRITPAMPQRSRTISYVVATDRGIDFAVAIFLLLMLIFLSRYPVPLCRNILTNIAIFSVYFLCNTFGMFLHTLFGRRLHSEINAALQGTSMLCVAMWLFRLSRQGEEVRRRVPRIGPEHQERILFQLDSLNNLVLRGTH